MILTLSVTIVVEVLVVLGYCIWFKKPVSSLLFTSIFANLITQTLLWVILNLFFEHYLLVLLVAEILIWIIESFLLRSIPSNDLGFPDAFLLSLCMNLVSFAIGWFLPV